MTPEEARRLAGDAYPLDEPLEICTINRWDPQRLAYVGVAEIVADLIHEHRQEARSRLAAAVWERGPEHVVQEAIDCCQWTVDAWALVHSLVVEGFSRLDRYPWED